MADKQYKLPYIPNKDLFKAVIGSCSWIRESGYFNKATNYYADKYGVNVDDVRKYVRIAQGNGQKIANQKKAPRKYHWYAIEFALGDGYNNYFIEEHAQYTIRKATSKDNAERAVYDKYFEYGNGSEWSFCAAYIEDVREFDNEADARKGVESMKRARKIKLRKKYKPECWEEKGLL